MLDRVSFFDEARVELFASVNEKGDSRGRIGYCNPWRPATALICELDKSDHRCEGIFHVLIRYPAFLGTRLPITLRARMIAMALNRPPAMKSALGTQDSVVSSCAGSTG